MTLSNFLKIKVVREKFTEAFPRSLSINKKILAIHLESYQDKCVLIVNDRGYSE